MIIDIHTHIYNEDSYKNYFRKSKGKISKALVMGWYKYDLENTLKYISQKDNLYLTGSVNMDGDIAEQVNCLDKYFKEKKIFGIKLYPGYQYFYPSDEKVYSIAELCQKYNKPLIFHSGDVYNPEKDALLKYSHPIHIDELAVKFPKCKIIISHIGFPHHIDAANVLSKNDNVYSEVSGTLDECESKKEATDMLNQYAKDLKRVFNYFPNVKSKIMFGTDYCGEDKPLKEIDPYINLIKKVFPKKEQDNVFYKLADKIFFQ